MTKAIWVSDIDWRSAYECHIEPLGWSMTADEDKAQLVLTKPGRRAVIADLRTLEISIDKLPTVYATAGAIDHLGTLLIAATKYLDGQYQTFAANE